jgi:hypothetical protein
MQKRAAKARLSPKNQGAECKASEGKASPSLALFEGALFDVRIEGIS